MQVDLYPPDDMQNLWSRFRGLPVWAQALIWLVAWPVIGGVFFYRSSIKGGKVLALVVAVTGLIVYIAAASGPQPTREAGALGPAISSTPTPSETPTTETPTPSETPTPEPVVPVMRATILRVVDGDTVDVRLATSQERVRLIGVDTPERGQGLFADATNYTARFLNTGRKVFLEKDVEERDRYGRLLAYVWVSRPETGSTDEVRVKMFNSLLVRKGLAKTLTIQPNSQYADAFAGFQREARQAKLGLWAPPIAPPAPAPPSSGNCDPSYPDVCIAPPPPDLDCGDVSYRRFRVVGDDPHGFDGDNDGIGCES